MRCDATSFSFVSLSPVMAPPRWAVRTRATALFTALTRSRVLMLCSNCSRRSEVVTPDLVTRGSSAIVRDTVEVQEPEVRRTEYLPGTATGPFGPSGRALLCQGPG